MKTHLTVWTVYHLRVCFPRVVIGKKPMEMQLLVSPAIYPLLIYPSVLLSSKMFDIELCPLPFSMEEMFGFISCRFTGYPSSVQEQALLWLHVSKQHSWSLWTRIGLRTQILGQRVGSYCQEFAYLCAALEFSVDESLIYIEKYSQNCG